LDGSATLVAVRVTVFDSDILIGAVYWPFDMVPTFGLMLQLTALLEALLTFALNCAVCPTSSEIVDGLRVTATAGSR
jgi:hypothetical protein